MLGHFFNIIRWKQLLYFAFLLFLFKFCFLYGYGFDTILSFFDLSLLALSGILILASGNLTTYSLQKQIKKTQIPLSKIKIYSSVFAFIGIFMGILLSFKIQKPFYSFVFFACFIFVYFYSKAVVKKTFLSSILKTFIKSFIILLVCWFDYPINLSSSQWDLYSKLQAIILLYVALSFLSNIVREIIIDINNLNHDNSSKHKTLPILLGRNRAKNIALTITILVSFMIIFVTVIYIKNIYIYGVIILFIMVPPLFMIYLLMNASSANDYKFIYKASNIGYFLAVLSIPIVSYFLKYVIN